jgi:drug/metabolite transporter (DMT)-like permease
MSRDERAHQRGAEFILFTTVVIWAANFPLAKWGIGGLGFAVFNAMRYVVAFLVLVLIYLARSSWTPIIRKDRGKLITVSILASIVYQCAFILGLSLTSAGNSAVILSTAPLWIVFLSSRMNKEQIRKSMWVGMVVSLCGIVMIVVGSGKNIEFGTSGMAGDLITLVAAMLWGLTTNLQKPLLARYSAVQLNLIMVSAGAVGLSIIAAPDLFSRNLAGVEASYFSAAVASGALSIGLGNMLWSVGVKRIGPGRAGNFGNLVPVLAFLIAYLVLDERILVLQIAGAAVTVGGVWLARR